ncbi:hypothetical protein [Calycomorphotria hydatis]|uniref:Uncharacterized protein n=1 Tax=Calycomorphotria hydatis TaxID=2528027 RepID=A0A517T9X9_9PLAN|nr:hypothetical protein [Calycomorphotria hydatis]QDT65182.1 hypothetical protein V22_24290 [Calycomorphotria hydatis]
MSKHYEIIEKLNEIEWFSMVGKRADSSVTECEGWDQAVKLVTSREWQRVRLNRINALTNFLHENHNARYQEWNTIVGDITPCVEKLLGEKVDLTKIVKKGGRKKFFVEIRLMIEGACIEAEYSDLVPPGFYTDLAEWYLKGHFPCGWEGEYPEGRLIVY